MVSQIEILERLKALKKLISSLTEKDERSNK